MVVSKPLDTQIASVTAPNSLIFRIAKFETDVFAPAPWRYVGSNRFDDPEGKYRVIYCTSDREAAFGETLARYRRSPLLIALMEDVDDDEESMDEAIGELIDPADPGRGVVPIDWRYKRRIGTTRLNPSPVFADIVDWESIEHLRAALASQITALKLPDFDASTVLSTNRQITQLCSRYIYEQHDDNGLPRFAGIRYPSRLNIDWSCWAIFDDRIEHDPNFNEFHETGIDPKDPDLLEVLRTMGLSLEAVRGHQQYVTGK